MKELALNSANDHNSDIDRKMLQKSFSSYVKNIDDIASTTNYNGKFLLNGNYGDAQNVDSISEEVIDDSDELIFHTAVGDLKYEVTGDVRYNTHEGLFPKVPERESLGGVKGFGADFDLNSLYKNKDRIVTIEKPNSKRTWWLNYPDPQGKTEVCYVVYEGIFPRKGEPVKEIPREGAYVWIDGDSIRINHLNRDCFVIKDWGDTLTFASYRYGNPLFESFHELDFSSYNGSIEDLNNEGFTIFCEGCYNSIGIKFDTEQEVGQAAEVYGYLPTADGAAEDKEAVYAYVVGIKGITNIADIPQAMYKGLSNVVGTKKTDEGYDSVLIGGRHSVEIIKKNNKYVLHKKERVHFVIAEGFKGSITGGTTKATNDAASTIVDNKPNDEKYNTTSRMKPKLIIHHGPKASQHLSVTINDMHSSAMGLDDTGVDPREKALESLEKIDQAIDYALNEIVRMGAYQSRLEYTLENIITTNENVTSAESVIRDADMAKEMTDYVKESILSQSAQAILTQANKKGSDVLSLLQ